MRFECSPTHVYGSKLFSRHEVNPRLRFEQSLDRGAFLARLWANFGPAAPHDAGFEYHLRDRDTGFAFTAYVGASGPSYGGDLRQRTMLRPVIETFERLLDATTPVDCAVTYLAEIEYGGGRRVLGWKAGQSFDIRDRRNQKPATDRDRRSRL